MKLKHIIFAFALATGLGSCELDKFPQDLISSENFWKTENDVNLALNGCYAYLDASVYDAYYDGYADNAYCQYSWESNAVNVSAGNINTDMNDGYNYEGIRRFNYFLDNVDKAPISKEEANQYKAEVKVLKAFTYFHLANKFGAVPVFTKSIQTADDAKVVPTPEADVIKYVIKELDEAIPNLPQPATIKSRISKAAALAIKARVQLYYQNWAGAAATSQEIMNLKNYSLFTADATSDDLKDEYSKFVTFANDDDKAAFYKGLSSYEKLFWNDNQGNDEVILEVEYKSDTDFSSGINTIFFSDNVGGGWSSITPTQELVNAYWTRDGKSFTAPTTEERQAAYANGQYSDSFLNEFKNRDTRLYASIMFPGSIWNRLMDNGTFVWNKGGSNISKTGYNFRKMTDPTVPLQEWNAPQNFPVIRYAEILLMYAEAQNEAAGPSPAVYDALDLIRSRVGMPVINRNTVNTKELLREVIRNERRIELAGEGFRWGDTRRWGISSSVMKNTYAVDGGLVQARIWDNKFNRLPYPQKAVDGNPNLKAAQTAKGY
ncbi:RagB/SusD family nutrient uptake outer membrane protein [Bacteroides sedimenti]|uniref:Membrane protein n=1 Tax=Bacteroides sedimenti TaxID=2136147 RepID=A0ABN6Z052_9BACE